MMKETEFDPFNMPDFMQEFWLSMDDQADKELTQAYQSYQEHIKNMIDIEEKYSFMHMIVFEDAEINPVELSDAQVRDLRRYINIKQEIEDKKKVQHYILGCRHAIQFLKFVGSI